MADQQAWHGGSYPGPMPPPPQPPARGPRQLGLVLAGSAVLLVLVVVGAATRDTRTRAETVHDILTPVARDVRAHCDRVNLVGQRLTITVPDGDTDCAGAAGAVLKAWGFTEVDVDRAARGQQIERGKFTLTAADQAGTAVIQIDVD